MTILYNTNYTHNPNSYLTIAVQRAAQLVFGLDHVVVADNRNIVELAATGQHQTLICLDGQRLNRNLIQRVRPAFSTLVLWLFEDPFMVDYNQSNADLFDFVFTNDPSCVNAYMGKGRYLPLAASRSLQFRPILQDKDLENDVFFAGTMWPNRVHTLRGLLRHFADKRFKLVCPTNAFLPPLPRDIAQRAIQWPVNHESFIDFANVSRVTLTMFRNYASHGTVSQATAPGPRMFELGLAGTAQVVEVDQSLPIGAFDVIRGVKCGASLPALITTIEAILADPELRHAHALFAQQSVESDHLYENRLSEIASVTNANFSRIQSPVPSVGVSNRKVRVLMCTHSTMREAEWGGVEVYQETLITALARSVEVLFWLRKGQICTLTQSDGTSLEQFSVPQVGWLDSLCEASEEVAFANVIAQYAIDIVHFQHLGHHTASLPIIAKASGAGTVWSAHDFFLVCSRYNLLDHDQVFCDIGNRSITACDVCLKNSEGVPAGVQGVRRAFIAEMLKSVDVLLFGTTYSEQLSLRIYPLLSEKRREVIGVPTPREVNEPPDRRPGREADVPLKVAVLGNFLRSKGADTVLNIIDTVDPTLFEFHIIGKAEPQYETVLRSWNRPNVVYHGRYDAGELSELALCDVSLHLSVWPETFCISLSESWQRGLVPIVTATGGLRDRVSHGETGFIVRISDASAVIGYLELLRTDQVTLTTMRRNISSALWVGLSSHAAKVYDVYRSLVSKANLGVTALGLDSGQVHLLPLASWRDLSPPRHIFDPARRSEISLELPQGLKAWIDSSAVCSRIDTLSGSTLDQIERGQFTASSRVEVNGWTFVPNMGISGQVFIGLIGQKDEETFFLKATRLMREDVYAAVPGAPQQAGFSAQATLYGKWSDGCYRIAIVNSFDDRATINLTQVLVTLASGQMVAVQMHSATPDQALKSFERITSRKLDMVPARFALPLDGVTILNEHSIRYAFESIGQEEELRLTGGRITPTARLPVRGWGVQTRDMAEAGDLYIGLVDGATSTPVFWETNRQLRLDVKAALSGLVPEQCGFEIDMHVLPEMSNGQWRVVMCSLVGTFAVIEITRLAVEINAGNFVSVSYHDIPRVEVEVLISRIVKPTRPAHHRHITSRIVDATNAEVQAGSNQDLKRSLISSNDEGRRHSASLNPKRRVKAG